MDGYHRRDPEWRKPNMEKHINMDIKEEDFIMKLKNRKHYGDINRSE